MAQTGLARKSGGRTLRAPEFLCSSWARDGRLGAGRRTCGDAEEAASTHLPPTAVREQRMEISERALLPSVVRPQASGPGSGGERLSPRATFQSQCQAAFPLPPLAELLPAWRTRGPVRTVGSQKPPHSLRTTPSWLMAIGQT